MAYMEFSTKDADFILQLHNHYIGSQDRKESYRQLEGIDALVLETGEDTLQNILTFCQSNIDPQYAHAIWYARDRALPIFGVDVRPGFIDYYVRDTLAHISTFFLSELFSFNFLKLKEEKISERAAQKYVELVFIEQNPIITARDAITAEKVEKYVIPHIRALTGKQHPKISLHYGTGHLGIRYDLESQLRRKITLWNLRNLNIPHYGGYKLDDLNTVAEAHYNGHVWEVMSTKLTPPLFT